MPPIEENSSRLPAIILTLILLLLAFRLTCLESLRETVAQKGARLNMELNPTQDNYVAPDVGSPYMAAYLTLAFFLTGGAAWSARRGGLSNARIGQLGLIVLIVGTLTFSTLHAVTRFPALLGTADICTALLCAWSVALLCQDNLLGNAGRHAVIAAIIATLTMGCAKAAMQHFIEFPDLAEMMKEHRDDMLRKAGVSPTDPVQVYLFMGRLNSMEVTGFGAMTNAFAAQLIVLAGLLTAMVIAAVMHFRSEANSPVAVAATAKPPRAKPSEEKAAKEIPLEFVGTIVLGIVLLGSILLIPLTDSNGGMASMAITLIALLVGTFCWKKVMKWRLPLFLFAVVGALAAGAALISYGISHNGLPTLSLLYRWQYWSGSVPMMRQAPLTGVGLNNFGEYYLQFKSPAAPEDVKDPHSFFVRLLAEAGIPATLLITGLLFWLLRSLWRETSPPLPSNTERPSLAAPLFLAGLGALVWVPLHLLTEGTDSFTGSMTMIYAVIGWGVFAGTMVVLAAVTAGSRHVLMTTRYITLAGVIAALGMFLYDQVNMALVTGPLAMLFWVLLALGDSWAAAADGKAARPVGAAIAGICGIAGIAAAVLFFVPVTFSQFPWDPAPHEFAFLRAITVEGNPTKALDSLDRAMERSPNSTELLMQRIGLRRERLKLSVAEDIRRVVQLDRANARIRLDVALPDSDLPAAERIAILLEALRLDQALPPKEPKHLTPDQLKKVEETLARLKTPQTPR